ncbi:type IV secretion system DNA-binding domain-containing protein [Bacteroides acidifaciens]|uniref:type IV secretory system conjugative DNA transfer family protein n=1 Tax=Bacteroides acidifaciens TaxID=85831 RepID=UPI0025948110|nr:type IV secretion system DNA-binding domain-containing protein [Bacteroides acidifaciens]
MSAESQKYQSNIKSAVTTLYVAGLLVLLLELYYTDYGLIQALNLNWTWLDLRLIKPAWRVLDAVVKVRSIILVLFLPILLFPTTKSPDKNLFLQIGIALIGAILFYLAGFWVLLPPPNYVGQVLNMGVSLGAAVIVIRQLFYFARYFSGVTASLDENTRYADGFKQMQRLIENKYSVNLGYVYHENLETKNGYINVVNPFRATSVIGTPGSGKTYAILEEYMYQMIHKGFSAVIYDYKDPALSSLAYNYLQSAGSNQAEFVYISFKDLNRTYRCNPLKDIVSSAEALDFATVILTALNKKFEEKKGDFFVESAKNYTALVIYLLGLLKGGRYQSLPHLLSLIGRKSATSFPVIRLIAIFYPDMKTLFGPFEQAFDNEVFEQLSGQLASAQIGLGSIADKELAYVMTEDPEDFSVELHVNSPEKPQVICIGNNPTKDIVYGLANSVYLSRLAKICNVRGTPCLFAVDELPTVFIKGLDNLIATGRSNLIAVLLGFQDDAQMIRDYGNHFADAMIKTIGNTFSGAVVRETAKKLSESFGEKKVKKVSKTVSQDGAVSTNINEVKERRIPQDTIEELSQGTFVGRVCDEFDTPFDEKVFHGSIQVDRSHKEKPYEIPKLRNHSDEEFDSVCRRNLIRIQTETTNLLSQVQEIANDYLLLRKMTQPDAKTDQNLFSFIEDPDNEENHIHLFVWLELVYKIIDDLELLELRNDTLTFDEKFDLLLLDVFEGDITGQNLIRQYRQDMHLMDYESVKKAIEQVERQMTTVAEQYSPFGESVAATVPQKSTYNQR